MSSERRVVVVGGDAAGMSAAAQAQRTAAANGSPLRITVLERGQHTSYSACGIPYWVAGDVADAAALVARSPQEHRARGLDVRTGTEAVAIDLDARTVHARDLAAGTELAFPYDDLVLATGASPVRPPVPGVDLPGIHGLQTLDDGSALLDALTAAGRPPRRAVVVGAGYIGVEVAEAFVRRGLETTVVDAAPEPMATLDHDMGALVRRAMEGLGIRLLTGRFVEAFRPGPDGRVATVVAGGEEIPADVVVLGVGVRPRVELAVAAGLPLGDRGGLRVDVRMAVPGHPGVWAAGDCVESFDRVSQSWVHVPLGTHANKQGRVLGTNLGGGYATFPGVVRTAVSKVCELEIARTGLLERDAAAVGFRCRTVVVPSTTIAGYMPGASPLTVKMLAEDGTGRILGVQIVGEGPGSAKRIDACAIALWHGMSAHDLAMADLSYAPPFSPVWDPIQIAARKLAGI
jgi:NADPH-dependent 2,4-dienoyl-CoA reductase/sulfur reductase-like enzyme